MRIVVFWIGNIGIAGKGPNWTEVYDGNKTIGEIARNMEAHGACYRGKRVKIIKHKPFSLKYDESDPHWAEDTKLSAYAEYYGGLRGQYLEMVYAMI